MSIQDSANVAACCLPTRSCHSWKPTEALLSHPAEVAHQRSTSPTALSPDALSHSSTWQLEICLHGTELECCFVPCSLSSPGAHKLQYFTVLYFYILKFSGKERKYFFIYLFAIENFLLQAVCVGHFFLFIFFYVPPKVKVNPFLN